MDAPEVAANSVQAPMLECISPPGGQTDRGRISGVCIARDPLTQVTCTGSAARQVTKMAQTPGSAGPGRSSP